MTTTDPLNLPFLWYFDAVVSPSDKSIHWKWRAMSQAGELVMQSNATFETRTECIEDAKARGYRGA
jgi:hypothetical protein